jgi:hypothetical protein
MKIWFRTIPAQGSEQSRRQHFSFNPTSLGSPPWPVSSAAPPTKNHAGHFLRRGAARCARRSLPDQHHSLADNHSIPTIAPPRQIEPQLARPHTASAAKKPPEIPQFGSRTDQPDTHCHTRSSILEAPPNRELRLLESPLSHRKQTFQSRSNRELSTNRCCGNFHLPGAFDGSRHQRARHPEETSWQTKRIGLN